MARRSNKEGSVTSDSKHNQIVVYPDEIKLAVEEGGKLVFKPEAENELVKLLELKKLVDEALDKVKTTITEAGKSINPNFKGVRGERVECTYRPYGSKYSFDWTKKSILGPFLKLKTISTVDGEAVDKYLKEVGELPDGIILAERNNTLSITYEETKDLLQPTVLME